MSGKQNRFLRNDNANLGSGASKGWGKITGDWKEKDGGAGYSPMKTDVRHPERRSCGQFAREWKWNLTCIPDTGQRRADACRTERNRGSAPTA